MRSSPPAARSPSPPTMPRPSTPWAWCGRSNNGPAALALLRRAVAIKPDLADAHNGIGSLLEENGELACARPRQKPSRWLPRGRLFSNFADANRLRQAIRSSR